ncbi:porin family protein [Flammeovirga pacifica]|uniref:Uncharacterized protein n=1 Tax=Flammeovirga pacifica TaxID=915059 RepID=A0A1S1YSY0_FLAPC|nr:hypothetical protein [Flammeovirga pacifica]OHX63915.1 hypothetical protein NH26_20100 [Flammeovirga pacifica]
MKNLLSCFLVFLSFYVSASEDPQQKKSNDPLLGAWKNFQQSLKFSLDSRLDFQRTNYHETTDVFATDQRFLFSNFRIGLDGMFNENFGFQFLYSPNDARVGMNNLNQNILSANVHYTSKNNRWHLKAGRSFLNIGTIEQTYNPNDVYTYSIIGNKFGIFKTGITTEYRTKKGQRLGLQIVNAQEDSLGHQVDLQYNVYWYGHLLEDKIKTYASYTAINDKGHIFNAPAYAIHLGIQWNLGKWQLDTDYAYVQNMPNFKENASYQSLPIRLMYKGEKFRPSVKYIYDQVYFNDPSFSGLEVSDAIDNTSIHTLEVALQYYPFPDKNFRFHIVGAYASDSFQYSSIEESHYFNSRWKFNVGVRIGFDVIKGW